MSATRVSDAEIVALFTGDELSDGYPSAILAEELCRRLRPGDLAQLRAKLYGDWPPDTISARELSALSVGFYRWWRAGRPC